MAAFEVKAAIFLPAVNQGRTLTRERRPSLTPLRGFNRRSARGHPRPTRGLRPENEKPRDTWRARGLNKSSHIWRYKTTIIIYLRQNRIRSGREGRNKLKSPSRALFFRSYSVDAIYPLPEDRFRSVRLSHVFGKYLRPGRAHSSRGRLLNRVWSAPDGPLPPQRAASRKLLCRPVRAPPDC
jgi:hypothetical protein